MHCSQRARCSMRVRRRRIARRGRGRRRHCALQRWPTFPRKLSNFPMSRIINLSRTRTLPSSLSRFSSSNTCSAVGCAPPTPPSLPLARSSVKLSECSLTARETSNVLRREGRRAGAGNVHSRNGENRADLLTDCLVVQASNDPLQQVARSTALRPNGTEN